MKKLWDSESVAEWNAAFEAYERVVDAQAVNGLPELDRWYRRELPSAIRGRAAPHIEHEELVRITEWKMKRGAWRARNLVLVRGNDAATVARTSEEALMQVPDPAAPIRILGTLSGVGPATASAVAAAAAPETYPFFDDLVADQVPSLGPVAYTMKYYKAYAAALRDRAAQLGPDWTPVRVERAVWASVGGKAGQPPEF